jgi:hypothetical protein
VENDAADGHRSTEELRAREREMAALVCVATEQARTAANDITEQAHAAANDVRAAKPSGRSSATRHGRSLGCRQHPCSGERPFRNIQPI